MARMYTPYRSLLSEADLEGMSPQGLLATPRSAAVSIPVTTNPMAEQIRSLYGKYGDWNYGGIDRAAELADLLQKQGITDVSKIALVAPNPNWDDDVHSMQAVFGDRAVGFVGDYNNDNTYGSNPGKYLKPDNTLGWSARGHGNVTYKVGTDAQGNNYLMPEWGSSSDMKDVRDAVKAAAVMAAMAYGLPMLGEAAGAAGAGEAAAAGSLTAGVTPASVAAWEAALPTALSSAPLSTTLAAPLAELGTVGGLSEAAINTLPTLTASAPATLTPSLLSSAPLTTNLSAPLTELGTVGGLSTDAISTLPAMAAPTTAASTAPYVMSSADKAAMLSGEAYGPGMSGLQTSAYDTALGATGSKTLADLAANAAGAGSTAANWLKDNPTLGKLLFSGAGALLNTAGGGGGSGGGGYVDSGYRPTISRGGFNAAPQARQMAPQPTMGLLNTPTTGQPMSGLWRYGLLGG